ncbi:MAG: tetratricopeptide repeat protein [Flavonifractor plautii]
MDTNANNNRESFEDQQVIFVDTHLIQKAVEGLQRAREEFQTLLEQAEGGDASVYYDLGVRYTEGDGTDKDPAQAARWFALASEDGDLRATDLLGRCYQSGAGVEKDEARAAELFQQAAERTTRPVRPGHGENGSGVEKDRPGRYTSRRRSRITPRPRPIWCATSTNRGQDVGAPQWRRRRRSSFPGR